MRYINRTSRDGSPKMYKNSKHGKTDKDGNVTEGFIVTFNPRVSILESIDEASQDAGGADKLLEWINDKRQQAAIRAGTTYDGGTSATEEGVKSKVSEIVENFTIATDMQTGRSSTTKENAAKWEQAKALAAAGNTDELMKLLGVA